MSAKHLSLFTSANNRVPSFQLIIVVIKQPQEIQIVRNWLLSGGSDREKNKERGKGKEGGRERVRGREKEGE